MNMPIESITKSTRPLRPLTIPVEGMTCASCVRRVETGAAKVPGVENSTVNFATKKLTVETGEGFDPEALEKIIHKLGYEVAAGAMQVALREAGHDVVKKGETSSSHLPGLDPADDDHTGLVER